MKNGNASEMSTGQILELTASVIRAIPKDMDPTVAQEWINNPQSLQDALRRNLLPSPKPQEMSVAELLKKYVLPVAFSLKVDYDVPLEVLIKRGKYSSKPDESRFNISYESKNGKDKTYLSLVHFGERIKSEDVHMKLRRMQLKPANLRELLTFGYKFPDIQRQFPIIALAWSHRVGGQQYNVPSLWGSGICRTLDASDYDTYWGEHCRFAAVPYY